MIDYIILEGANGEVCQLDPNVFPIQLFDVQTDVRNDQTDKVQQHGQWQTFDYMGRTHMAIQGLIFGNSPWDYWTQRRKLANVFIPVPEAGFRWTVNARVKFTGLSEEVESQFSLDGRPDMPINADAPAQSPFNINMSAADPRFYASQQQAFDTGVPTNAGGGLQYNLTYNLDYGGLSTGGDAFLNNAGNSNTYPVVVINGPCTNPSLTIYTPGGQAFTLSFSNLGGLHVASGSSVIVDFKNRTVVSDKGANLFQYARGIWWYLFKGINHVKFGAASAADPCFATFQWQNAYLI